MRKDPQENAQGNLDISTYQAMLLIYLAVNTSEMEFRENFIMQLAVHMFKVNNFIISFLYSNTGNENYTIRNENVMIPAQNTHLAYQFNYLSLQ